MCALCGTGASAENSQCSVAAGADAATSQSEGGAGAGELQAPGSPKSYQQIANYLTTGYWGIEDHQWIDMDGGGTGANITFNIEGLTAAGQQLALSALQAWQDVCNVTFVRTTGAAELSFDDNSGGASTGWTFGGPDGTYIVSSYINVGTSWLNTYGTGFDSYSYQTYIHEIGHALGLGHAGPYNGGGSYNTDAIYANDTWQYSIMSYWQQSNFGGGSTRFVMTPEIADILAVQMQYGAATETRTGSTVYGFNATAGAIFNFAGYASAPALTIYDNGGNDTVDCSGYSANQVIDLRAGSYSSVGGLVNNIGIALDAVIENAVGGAGSDVITGSGANGAWLHGLDGNDTIMAYAGNMQLGYGDGGHDQLFFIGNQNQLYGGDGSDWLGVNGNANALIGVDGNEWMGASGIGNTVVGGEGGDTLFSVGGNVLYGETGDDWIGCSGNGNVLDGAQGNDYLAATGNNNILDGGAGNDILVAGGSHSGDRFVFHPGYGMDLIANFSRHGAGGTDVIDLRGFGLNFNSLQSYLSFQPNGAAVITIDAASVLTIANGIPPNGFMASDFIF